MTRGWRDVLVAMLALLAIAGASGVARASVGRVQMRIDGYLCGN